MTEQAVPSPIGNMLDQSVARYRATVATDPSDTEAAWSNVEMGIALSALDAAQQRIAELSAEVSRQHGLLSEVAAREIAAGDYSSHVVPAVPEPAEPENPGPEMPRIPCPDDCWATGRGLSHHHEDWGSQGGPVVVVPGADPESAPVATADEETNR